MEESQTLISYKDLFTEYGWSDSDLISGALAEMGPDDGLVLYQNNVFDSSSFGELSLVMVGSARTFKSADEAPPFIGDVPSRIKSKVGQVDLNKVRAGEEAIDAYQA